MLAIKENKILEVAQKTEGQTDNQAWLISRKHRLTYSNFGEILKAARRQRYTPSLFKKLSGSYDLIKVKQIQWGRQNEINGIQSFEKLTGAKVVRTGLWQEN
ncbi:uncharacterized protein [Leptinotarsa decemlineata]|uniref:uncharacterized protein n=1 Tax=Leptinotarsa decemlineata TaxID=7539 RepID=UPI003D306C1D